MIFPNHDLEPCKGVTSAIGTLDRWAEGAGVEPVITSGSSWLLVPAPPDLNEPAFSFDSYDSPLYPPEAIAAAILSVPGMQLVRPVQPSWGDWRARWESAGHLIELTINVLDAESEAGKIVAWESSLVNARCHPSDLFAIWNAIRSVCPGVWLDDDDSRLWSPWTFNQLFAADSSSTAR